MSSRLHQFLRGVRILDLSRHLPGPLATLLLADMGAEVIKIEPPAGDEMRQWGPLDEQGKAVMFEAVNAGKLLKTIDLKTPEGHEEILALADHSDVLIESFRPGVMDRLGAGHKVLRERNQRLIYCALSGYGQTSPLRDLAGHDVNYLSRSGLLHSNGSVETPSLISLPLADCTASMMAATSILGALSARAHDGQGCFIDIALADVCAPLNLFALAEMGLTGQPPSRGRGWLTGGWARYHIYATADHRQVSLGAVEHKFWKAFCLASGKPQWVDRYGDLLPQDRLIKEVGEHLKSLTLAECLSIYVPADCCLTAVDDLATAAESAHTHARNLVRRHVSMNIFEASFPAHIDGLSPDCRRPLRCYDK